MFDSEMHEQKGRIRERFIRCFDPSAIGALLDNLLKSNGSIDLQRKGSGQHFDVWQASFHGFAMAVKVSNGNSSRGVHEWREWLDLMAQAKDLEATAPLLLCSNQYWYKDHVVQVMPWGVQQMAATSTREHQKDATLAFLMEKTLKVLTAHHLSLGDTPQVRWLGKTPFLVDLSSLTQRNRRPYIDPSQRKSISLRR